MLKWRIVALLGLSMWFLLAGCQTLGPSALGVGRGAYNDVIARTSFRADAWSARSVALLGSHWSTHGL